MAFKPERFINPDGSLNDENRVIAFGFGRACAGQHVASATVSLSLDSMYVEAKGACKLWLTIASILAKNAETKLVVLSRLMTNIKNLALLGPRNRTGWLTSLLTFPSLKKPFECSILPRSPEARRLIEELDG
ncbi:hypothetical protein CVT25_006656 [Psilocybe cyanescens]|uniref:Cytochrome P450 n=1 Tax=Psilocybe cyanescens TaxID=93625 RepID=A0A409XU25_PSICY|nr:hypothetical protein CVT25_006656 [Psilocybe cyanescens]